MLTQRFRGTAPATAPYNPNPAIRSEASPAMPWCANIHESRPRIGVLDEKEDLSVVGSMAKYNGRMDRASVGACEI